MMNEQVIVSQVFVKRAGQVRHFQIRLPKNTKRIIGIEYGIGIISNVQYNKPKKNESVAASDTRWSFITFNKGLYMGELKLQSCEEANIFYSEHIKTNENFDQGDFSKTGDWIPSPYTHQGKTEEDIVMVNGDSTIINGVYKDKVGELYKMDLEYILNVYVWIKSDREQKKGESK